MAVSMSQKHKVYQSVLQELRKFIEVNHLKSGDKLPSERQLAEKLQAGRSSVREALRAIELLGIIETRHGEGTFLSSYQPMQTVEILASFILKESTTKDELVLVKLLIEKEAAKLAYFQMDEHTIDELQSMVSKEPVHWNEVHDTFFTYLLKVTNNHLLTKIWKLVKGYAHSVEETYYQPNFYLELLQNYKTKNYDAIENLFIHLHRKG